MSLNKELKELVHSTYEKATHIIQEVKNTFEHEKSEKYSNTVVSHDEMAKTAHQIEENVAESLINTSKLDKVESENKIAVSKLDM